VEWDSNDEAEIRNPERMMQASTVIFKFPKEGDDVSIRECADKARLFLVTGEVEGITKRL
jgi:hypothetical protein